MNLTDLPELVQERIQPDARGCWQWTGRLDSDGYGRYGKHMAHRLVYSLLVATVDKADHVDHLCLVRACVNPAHLEAVSVAENNRRRIALMTHCSKGHEFTPENTYRVRRGNGYNIRLCRICERARRRAYCARRKAKKETAT